MQTDTHRSSALKTILILKKYVNVPMYQCIFYHFNIP